MRAAFTVAVSSLSLLVAAAARGAELEARGPAECPDAAELGFRVERNLGSPLAQAPAVKLSVEMERSAAAYAARLSIGGGGAEDKARELTAPSCEELADAVVVAMTLALGVAAAPVEAEHEAPAASPESPPVSAPPVSTPPAPAADTRGAEVEGDASASSLRPSLLVAALVDFGSLPEPAPGVALGAELSWARLELRAAAMVLLEQHTEVAGAQGAAPGADLQLFAGSLLGCTSAVGGAREAFTAPVCLGFELGWLSGVGTGVAAPRSGSAPWAAARADVGARWCWRGSPICLAPTASAAVPIARSRFELTDIGTVYRPPSVVGRLSVGVEVGFD